MIYSTYLNGSLPRTYIAPIKTLVAFGQLTVEAGASGKCTSSLLLCFSFEGMNFDVWNQEPCISLWRAGRWLRMRVTLLYQVIRHVLATKTRGSLRNNHLAIEYMRFAASLPDGQHERKEKHFIPHVACVISVAVACWRIVCGPLSEDICLM